jgi:hypothetical protein
VKTRHKFQTLFHAGKMKQMIAAPPLLDCDKSVPRKLGRHQAKKQAQKARKRQSAREVKKSSRHKLAKKKYKKSVSSKVGQQKGKPVARAMTHQTLPHLPPVSQRVTQKMDPMIPPQLLPTKARRSRPSNHLARTPLSTTITVLTTKRRARNPRKIADPDRRPRTSTSTKTMTLRQATPSGVMAWP